MPSVVVQVGQEPIRIPTKVAVGLSAASLAAAVSSVFILLPEVSSSLISSSAIVVGSLASLLRSNTIGLAEWKRRMARMYHSGVQRESWPELPSRQSLGNRMRVSEMTSIVSASVLVSTVLLETPGWRNGIGTLAAGAVAFALNGLAGYFMPPVH